MPEKRTGQPWLSRTFESLGVVHFRHMWFGTLLSIGGFQMQAVAGGILVYDITGDAFVTALVALGFAPSLLIVSLFAGVIGDRFERRSIIQIAQGVNGLLALLVGVLIITGVVHWSQLLAVSVIQGAMFAIQLPARQAAIPALVGKERMGNAIALNAMAMSLMTVAAPGIGGILYGTVGAEYVYFVVAAMMGLAVGFTGIIPRMYPSGESRKRSVLQNVRDGFRYIGSRPLVRMLLIQGAVMAVLSMPFRMLIVVFAEDVYGSGPNQVGYLIAAAGVGGLIGSLGIAGLRKGNRRGLVLLASGVLSGVAIGLMAAVPVYVFGMALMVGVGMGESARWALGQALIMEETDEDYRARVMSVTMMTFGLLPLGAMPLGYAMRRWSAESATLGMAAILLVAALFFLITSRSIRQLR